MTPLTPKNDPELAEVTLWWPDLSKATRQAVFTLARSRAVPPSAPSPDVADAELRELARAWPYLDRWTKDSILGLASGFDPEKTWQGACRML